MKLVFFIAFVSLVLLSGFLGFSYLADLKKDLGVSLVREKPKKVVDTFAVFSDPHSDTEMTKQALIRAKEVNVPYIFGLGDLTTVGTKEELRTMKELFDESGIPYHWTIGDHDLWQTGKSNFESLFGKTYYSLSKENTHYIFLDTSDTKKGIGEAQLNWLKSDLEQNKKKNILVFMHLPLYHPLNARTIWEKGGENSAVKKEVDQILQLFTKYPVKAVFAGDHHLSNDYIEPTSNVKMYIVGAITSERNLQKSRFSVVTVFEDGSLTVKEEVLNNGIQ